MFDTRYDEYSYMMNMLYINVTSKIGPATVIIIFTVSVTLIPQSNNTGLLLIQTSERWSLLAPFPGQDW